MAKKISKSWVADQGSSGWLQHDPRSALAMLRGCGDGREKLYERFCAYHRGVNPAVTEEDLVDGYAEYAAKMDATCRRSATVAGGLSQYSSTFQILRPFFFVGRLIDRHMVPLIGTYVIAKWLSTIF